jgi:hypothetical protein
MRLNPPKKITLWITIALAAVGVVIYVVHLFAESVPYLQPAAFALVLIAYGLLAASLFVKGL